MVEEATASCCDRFKVDLSHDNLSRRREQGEGVSRWAAFMCLINILLADEYNDY